MPLDLLGFHHIAIIASDIERSKRFYTEALGFSILQENYRAERQSWKVDLIGTGGMRIELFSFPTAPSRSTRPEACGLRHLAFRVQDISSAVGKLRSLGLSCEPVRVDEYTGKRFTFLADPDDLPLELYEESL